MSFLITTIGGLNSNAYITVAEGDSLLSDARLYTTAWANDEDDSDGEGWLVNGPVVTGNTVLAVDSGVGKLTRDSKLTFASHSTVYTVQETLYETRTRLVVDPALTANVGDGEAITRRSASSKELAILWATNLLDESMDWDGTIANSDQALRWPRSGAKDIDGTTFETTEIPNVVQRATAEMAMALLERNRTVEPELFGLGFEEAKIDVLEVKVDLNAALALIPNHIVAILDPVGSLLPIASTGDRVMRIERT